MKKIFSVFCSMLILIASGCAKKEQLAIKIGNIEITAQEFEAELRDSRYPNDPSGRRAFLDQFIQKKLILHEAEKLGLDKNPQFLKDVQFYWEQGLLKLVLTQKTKELMGKIQVTDREINDYYRANQNSEFANTELSQVYNQIKWLLFQEKQSGALAGWVDDLEQKTPVRIDYNLLGITK
jgi:hypothetical protein